MRLTTPLPQVVLTFMIIVIIGAQWGDEGKGKVVDLLADRFDIVSRYQGGHNAGHSVYVQEKAFVLQAAAKRDNSSGQDMRARQRDGHRSEGFL